MERNVKICGQCARKREDNEFCWRIYGHNMPSGKFKTFHFKYDVTALRMMETHSSSSFSFITNGGAKRMISPWVGLASKPRFRSRMQISQASNSAKEHVRYCSNCSKLYWLTGLNNNSVKKSFSSDQLDHLARKLTQLSSQDVAHFFSIFC